MTFDVASVRFDASGLVPVVAQDHRTGDVLMVAWADKEALQETLRSGEMHYHSRSRGRLWRKGEESGNAQRVLSLHADCDGDTVLALVEPRGPSCHTGAPTCFAVVGGAAPGSVLPALDAVIAARMKDAPSGSYTAKLLADANLRAKKVGEEATELVMALGGEGPKRVASEAADLIYHALVACRAAGVSWSDVAAELGKRQR